MFYILIGLLSTLLGLYWWKRYSKSNSKFDLLNALFAIAGGGLLTAIGISELF